MGGRGRQPGAWGAQTFPMHDQRAGTACARSAAAVQPVGYCQKQGSTPGGGPAQRILSEGST